VLEIAGMLPEIAGILLFLFVECNLNVIPIYPDLNREWLPYIFDLSVVVSFLLSGFITGISFLLSGCITRTFMWCGCTAGLPVLLDFV